MEGVNKAHYSSLLALACTLATGTCSSRAFAGHESVTPGATISQNKTYIVCAVAHAFIALPLGGALLHALVLKF
jgi:hypothetical protein